MLNKRKNYKILIGIMIGILLSGPFVYAATTYIGNGADLTYSNTKSGLSSTNVQDALDELYNKDRCPSDYICIKKKNTLALGDYVSYTPTKSSYTTDSSITGWSSRTINPQELNLWRVIRLNTDGTVELISEHVSSQFIDFNGEVGYRNFVGYLNVLASQYENSTYTIGSRYFGYNGQTEYIPEDSTFYNPAESLKCSTGESCNPAEGRGGGDILYEADYNLVKAVLGTLIATDPSENEKDYWMASRYYEYLGTSTRRWYARYVMSGYEYHNPLYIWELPSYNNYSEFSYLRPIVILRSGLKYDGVGTEANPMEIIG